MLVIPTIVFFAVNEPLDMKLELPTSRTSTLDCVYLMYFLIHAYHPKWST